MKIKGVIEEDFINFKLPSMYIAFPSCTFKCDKENKCQLCQNWNLTKEPTKEISKEDLIERYIKNPLSEAFVLGGLEPFDSEFDLFSFIDCVRRKYECNDPIIIYTGYTEEEIEKGKFGTKYSEEMQKQYWKDIKDSGNIIVKFGRFRPNNEPHFDDILGVNLSSDNQYAKFYKGEK